MSHVFDFFFFTEHLFSVRKLMTNIEMCPTYLIYKCSLYPWDLFCFSSVPFSSALNSSGSLSYHFEAVCGMYETAFSHRLYNINCFRFPPAISCMTNLPVNSKTPFMVAKVTSSVCFRNVLVSKNWVAAVQHSSFTPYLLCAYDDVKVRKIFSIPRRMLLLLSVQAVPHYIDMISDSVCIKELYEEVHWCTSGQRKSLLYSCFHCRVLLQCGYC